MKENSNITVIFLSAFLFAASNGLVMLTVPRLLTDVFAYSSSLPTSDTCNQEFPESDYRKDLCGDANSSAQDAVASTELGRNLLTLISAPVMGYFSDLYGRKPFLIISFLFALFPVAFLYLFVQIPLLSGGEVDLANLEFGRDLYYITNVATGICFPLPILLTVVTDVMPVQFRAPGYGVVLTIFLLGFTITSLLVASVPDNARFLLSLGSGVGSLLFLFIALRETLPPSSREAALVARGRENTNNLLSRMFLPFKNLNILTRSSVFRCLALLVVFSTVVQEGSQILLIYYLEDNFDVDDSVQAQFLAVIGISCIISQGILLRPCLMWLGAKNTLLLTGIVGAVHTVIYAYATSVPVMLLGGVMVCVSFFAFPTISAIKSNNAEEHEQGVVQGALMSAKSLAAAVGPSFFRLCNQVDLRNTLGIPYQDGAMWLAGSVLYLISTYFIARLPRDKTDFDLADSLDGTRSKEDASDNWATEEKLLSTVA